MIHHRIISLLPAATEMVCAMDCADQLVGRSHECDFPEEVRALPICTAAKVNSYAPSADIDRQTKALSESGQSLYQVDAAKLKELQPNLILTQGQCEVCAVSEEDVRAAISRWPNPRPQIVSLGAKRFADLWNDMRVVGQALDLPDQGKAAIQELKARCVNVIEKACQATNQRPSVACVEWLDPLMAAGNWVPDMVEMAGGRNVLGEAGKHSPWMKWGDLMKANPDIVVMMPCGFDIARTRKDLPVLAHNPEWTTLRAVRDRRVFLADGSHYFNRPGPRLIESLEILAEIINPKLFKFGHEGKGWERL